MPVISRAGLAMGFLDIQIGNSGIASHHIKRAMPEQSLQGENIPTRAKIGDRKGVPEAMRIGILYIRSLSNTLNQLSQ